MLPPAPPTFSMMTGWPSSGRIRSAMMRATVSVDPPGGNGTTSVIGARRIGLRLRGRDGTERQRDRNDKPCHALSLMGGGVRFPTMIVVAVGEAGAPRTRHSAAKARRDHDAELRKPSSATVTPVAVVCAFSM